MIRRTSAKVKRIAKALSYGIEWYKDCDELPLYKLGAKEAVAHVGACLITQTLTNDSTDTADIVAMIDDNPSWWLLTRRVAKYANEVKALKP
jgi:hypothetical protein